MNEKVKALRPANTAPLGELQLEGVAVAREILDGFLSGEIVGLVAIAVTKDNAYLPNIAGEFDSDAMIGRLFRTARLIDDADDEEADDEND